MSEPRADEVAAAFLQAWHDGDREAARLLLHPYLHWVSSGQTRRGRSIVLASLPPRINAADRVELRDDQIYRWIGSD